MGEERIKLAEGYPRIKISDIKISGYNPRKITKSEMEKVKRNLREGR